MFEGKYGTTLMFFATLVSAVTGWILYSKSKKGNGKRLWKTAGIFPVGTAVCNVLLNLAVMALALSPLSPSLIYPVIGVGGLIIVTVVSLFLFREKMRWWQWLGVVTGLISVGLLSL